MELYIAGGCGEHGRNCFYLWDRNDAYLIDCGLIAGKKDNLPRLSLKQMNKIRAVFLTHSHTDHTGALPWLRRQGYDGPVVATSPTLEQLPFELKNTIRMEDICERNVKGHMQDLALAWGLSGHCAGSIWIQLEWRNKTVLFSGDYCEQSRIYLCDALRGKRADLAVLDCAYGHDCVNHADDSSELVYSVQNLLKRASLIFLPVPKYGRGLDLLLLLHEAMPKLQFYGDPHFCQQTKEAVCGLEWYQRIPSQFPTWLNQDMDAVQGIVFLSDPQLRGASGIRAKNLLKQGALGLMTGTPDPGSFSAELLQNGQMEFCRYPVHLDAQQCQMLMGKNDFGIVVPYHSPEFACGPYIKIGSRCEEFK